MLSFVIVLTPTLGSTLKRGLHRVFGTIIGGIAALVTLVAGTYTNSLAILITFTFIFSSIATYTQYSSLYQKPYSMVVAVLTFLVIAYPAYPNVNWKNWNILYRFLNIIAGVLLGIIASLPFPVLTYQRLNQSLVDTVAQTASILSFFDRKDDVVLKVTEINNATLSQCKLLKEAKSELFFFFEKRKLYSSLTEQMSNIAFFCVVAEEASRGFSQQMLDEVFSPLRSEFLKISKIADIHAKLFKSFMTTSELHPTHRIAVAKIKYRLNKIYKEHRKTREHLYNSKQLHQHPEMLRFNAFLFTAISLLEQWQKLMELVVPVNDT